MSDNVYVLPGSRGMQLNTDMEISAFDSPSGFVKLFLSQDLKLGINVDGRVIVMSPAEWHRAFEFAAKEQTGGGA